MHDALTSPGPVVPRRVQRASARLGAELLRTRSIPAHGGLDPLETILNAKNRASSLEVWLGSGSIHLTREREISHFERLQKVEEVVR
jgi:hypothetical protein